MLTVFLIALMGQQPGVERTTPLPELRVVVSAPVYHPDGAVIGETITLEGTPPSVLYVFSRRSLCDTAPATAAEPSDAGFGWRLASHVVRASETQIVVNVDWRREWDRGQKIANGPAGSSQLTLKPGDRIPLDHIPNALPTDACRAVGMGLEVRLGRAAPPPLTAGITLPVTAREGGAGSLDVDLWLLHTTPSGSQQAQHQIVRLTTAGGMFTFAPVRFDTTRGQVGMELTGAFQRYRATTGGEFLLVSLSRVVTGPDAPPAGFGGTTSSLIALPQPDEILSFEMTTGAGGFGGARGARGRGGIGAGGARGPGAGGSGGRATGAASARPTAAQTIALLEGHRFALRLKVTPVPGM